MIVLGERAIVAVLRQAYQEIKSNLSFYIPYIYGQEDTTDQEDIMQWWQTYEISIVQAYPEGKVTEPTIAVAIEPGRESKRFVSRAATISSSPNYIIQTQYHGRFSIHAITINQDSTLWVWAFIMWAMQLYTFVLEYEPYGLMNQVISYTGQVPRPNSADDSIFPYERIVYLDCDFENTVMFPPVPAIKSATPTIINTNEGG